jgi:pimeloyl-ACP methyl ester carboxylesterase
LLIDLPGYGYSSHPPTFPHTLEAHADSTAHLLDRLGAPHCHVIGHSMGGAIAITLAARRPDLVSSLTVIEPNLDPEDAFFSGVVVTRWSTEADFLQTGYQELMVETEAEARAEPNRLDLGSYAGTLRASDPRAIYRCAQALVACDVRDAFIGLSMPRTYVYGERTLPHRHETWLQAAGVPIAIVADAGHDVPNDNPDGLAAVIASTIPE